MIFEELGEKAKGTKCEACKAAQCSPAQRERHAEAQRARREREAYQKAQELASATAYLFCTDCAASGFHRLDCPTVGLCATVLPRAA